MKTCIIIPTYNEAATIGYVIEHARQQVNEVIIIDDGSTDRTAQVSRDNGATVLRNLKNEGKGISLIRGLDYALDKDYDAVITMDGDGQHCPNDIPRFIQCAEASNAGMFIGNRMCDLKNMPFLRVLTNKFMSWFISALIKQKVWDSQCGFRLIKRGLLEKLKFTTRHFETETEVLFQASRLNYKIESVPIKTIYQTEKSQINPFLDTMRFISFIWRQIWSKQ
ncbi:MAG: glycosyltransferase family 2 protein [Candidatus Omnitrophota bacterium]